MASQSGLCIWLTWGVLKSYLSLNHRDCCVGSGSLCFDSNPHSGLDAKPNSKKANIPRPEMLFSVSNNEYGSYVQLAIFPNHLQILIFASFWNFAYLLGEAATDTWKQALVWIGEEACPSGELPWSSRTSSSRHRRPKARDGKDTRVQKPMFLFVSRTTEPRSIWAKAD